MFNQLINKLISKIARNHNQVDDGVIPKEFISKFLPKNPVVVEAGAHVGLDTIDMSKFWPLSIIYAFEPIPELFQQLVNNTQSMRNVNCYPLALSDKSGLAEMFVSSGSIGANASSSLLPPKEHLSEHPHVLFQKVIEVPTITLDDWAEKNRVNKIDFLWLDMQGYELAALKVSPKILRTVKTIYTEVCLKELYEGCPLYPEMRRWLEEQGFRVEREELAWADAGNVLFIKEQEALGGV